MEKPWPTPPHYDVVLAGGGIIGVCTALFLREKGLSVAVLDKGRPGYEQSSRNWGWVRTISQAMEELPLAVASRPLWEQWAKEGDFGYTRSGLLSLAQDQDEWQGLESWLAAARTRGFDARELGRSEISTLLPQSRGQWAGALYSPGDGRAEPDSAMRFLVRKAEAAGVVILPDTAVKSIDIQGGRACGFETENGRISASSVVVAAGIWSRWLCKTVDIVLPQLKVIASVLRTEPVAGGPDPIVASSRFSLRRRMDGGYTVAQRNSSITYVTPDSFRFLREFMPNFLKQKKLLSVRIGSSFVQERRQERQFGKGKPNPFEQFRACDPTPDSKTLARTMNRLRADMPVFEKARIATMWAGVIDVVPDALPILSPVARYPGLYVATGFSAHGFGVGPASGKLMANLITGEPDTLGRDHFTLDRFGCNGEGSRAS
ncbi:FAD-binding oxidoreductase [Acetobacter farinalis]|uniref:FAD-binding oxidoreductase n=1 Tax=Acetobacter farinalis TaxID=1260984 RepID=A0ABT3Q8U0_9PROT|nr:FAD-binding oxidoreductase [Acetobacter farinalis]MCX2561703.1 FAD-binding oxidoreductase [Acetobacter farinalis]NHO30200.1 FAD-dependent oxidoreductase [Acetobacter farinalis]